MALKNKRAKQAVRVPSMLAREKAKKDAKQAAAAAAVACAKSASVYTTLMVGGGPQRAGAPQLPSPIGVSPVIVQIVVKSPQSLPASSLWSKQPLGQSAAQNVTMRRDKSHRGNRDSERQNAGMGALQRQPVVANQVVQVARVHSRPKCWPGHTTEACTSCILSAPVAIDSSRRGERHE